MFLFLNKSVLTKTNYLFGIPQQHCDFRRSDFILRSNGLSRALYYPEFLFPALCSSRAPDPHLAWLDGHSARGELEEIVCSPSVCSGFSLWMFPRSRGATVRRSGLMDVCLQHFCGWWPHLYLRWRLNNTNAATDTEVSIRSSASPQLRNSCGLPSLSRLGASKARWREKNTSCRTDRGCSDCQISV